jgi:hypothetical protein
MSKSTAKQDTASERVLRRDEKGCRTVKDSAGRSLSQAENGNSVIRRKDSATPKDSWTEADRALFRAWDKVHENQGRK